MFVNGRIDQHFSNPGGDKDGGDAHSQASEIEWRISSHFSVRIGDRIRRRHMVEETTVFVVQNQQKTTFPIAGGTQRFINFCNKIFTQSHIMRRMLVRRLPMMKIHKTRLDKGVVSQFSILQVLEVPAELLKMTQGISAVLQDDALRNVAVIHIPSFSVFEKDVEKCLHFIDMFGVVS